MWDNPRLLNLLAGALVGVAGFAFAIAGTWMLLRSELFPVREVVLASPVRQTSKEEIQASVRERITGNFFAVSPEQVRAGLESLPWVRSASVRRVWPDRLVVALEEHVALAHWGDDALINTHGERFTGKTSEPLPLFVGPPGSEAEVARAYARFAHLAAPLGTGVERVVLTPRFAWQLRLQNGLYVMLGRDAAAAEARLARFVGVYALTLGTLNRRHEYVDLRYPNGFVLRVGEMKGT